MCLLQAATHSIPHSHFPHDTFFLSCKITSVILFLTLSFSSSSSKLIIFVFITKRSIFMSFHLKSKCSSIYCNSTTCYTFLEYLIIAVNHRSNYSNMILNKAGLLFIARHRQWQITVGHESDSVAVFFLNAFIYEFWADCLFNCDLAEVSAQHF